MNTVLGLTPRQRAELFQGAARQLGFGGEVIVEKDFWVCWVLKQLFTEIEGYDQHLVFKGGTSLSKVYNAINRFSEDVDITIGRELLGLDSDDHDPEKAPNPSQKRRRIEALRQGCSGWVAGDLSSQLEAKTRAALGGAGWRYELDGTDEDRQTLLFHYPSALADAGAGAYIPRFVRIECGAKADTWPVTPATIKPYVAEAYPKEITDAAIDVRTLAVERTFWEKVTILHAEANRPPDKPTKLNYSRHYADTAALATHAGGARALLDADLRKRVVAFKEAFYRSPTTSFETAVPGTFRLLPGPAHMAHLEADYRRMQREMYFGISLEWSAILATLQELEGRINRLGE